MRKVDGAGGDQQRDHQHDLRTIITHGCTQMMVPSMLVFGGQTLHYFALALTIGICFGIYSSVLVAARWSCGWASTAASSSVPPRSREARTNMKEQSSSDCLTGP